MKTPILVMVLLFGSTVGQPGAKHPVQTDGKDCNPTMTFCWYDTAAVNKPEVFGYGKRWVSPDKDEQPLEWVTAVRCVQAMKVCILAHNQKLPWGDLSATSIDLYYVLEWNSYEIRAILENAYPVARGCSIDSLLLNRQEASISILSVPGPQATTKSCLGLLKPKTVMYKLAIGS